MTLKPDVRVVKVSTSESEVLIPRGVQRVSMSPRTAVTVQVAFVPGESNTDGKFFQLVSGQPFDFDAPLNEVFDEFTMVFYAASAVTLDIVFW